MISILGAFVLPVSCFLPTFARKSTKNLCKSWNEILFFFFGPSLSLVHHKNDLRKCERCKRNEKQKWRNYFSALIYIIFISSVFFFLSLTEIPINNGNKHLYCKLRNAISLRNTWLYSSETSFFANLPMSRRNNSQKKWFSVVRKPTTSYFYFSNVTFDGWNSQIQYRKK